MSTLFLIVQTAALVTAVVLLLSCIAGAMRTQNEHPLKRGQRVVDG